MTAEFGSAAEVKSHREGTWVTLLVTLCNNRGSAAATSNTATKTLRHGETKGKLIS
ncbi:MAG: hypothetical protein ACMVP2_05985 [Imperialibacter sp.]|uniref:hypothetical protein n=1 Tax=Imperialibacter sp. TaxID=2038411 RepID=UPI003A835F6C